MGQTEQNAYPVFFLEGPNQDLATSVFGEVKPGLTYPVNVTPGAMDDLAKTINNNLMGKDRSYADIHPDQDYASFQASNHPFFRLNTYEENANAAYTKNKEVANQLAAQATTGSVSKFSSSYLWLFILAIIAFFLLKRS
jgi:hypothetical protein